MALPAHTTPATPKIHPRTVGGPAMQAPTSKKQCLRKKIIAISKFHRRGEHCSPAKALCCRKAPRVEQGPTPTINRKRMREIFIALSQFHRRGGAPLRPGLPNAASAFRPAPTPNTPRPHRSSQPPTPDSSFLIPTPNSPKIKNPPKTKKSQKNLKNSQNFPKNTSKMAQLIANS